MSEEKKVLNLQELEDVAGGNGIADVAGVVKERLSSGLSIPASERENMAAVCGKNTVKIEARTVTAYCSKCGKDTMFYVGSGARGKCSVCGTERTDL